MATVELKNVVKHYPKNAEPTVRGVDLFIQDREFMVLVGPSGCGKSTVLRMIAGLEDLTSGELFIDGKRVNDLCPKDRNIAMVFQNYALFPHLTVRDNIVFGMRIRGKPKAEQDEAVARAARILGLEQLLMRKPGELSGGQRQRVAVGRAIVRHPAVFLFDEPLSNLDAKLRVQMRAEIIKLHRQIEATMVYVTHDQIEAMTMSDRIVVFHGGRIQQVGTPQEVYQHPANRFVAGFIGSPPMNFLEGRIESTPEGSVFVSKQPGGIRLPLGNENRTIPAMGKDGVTLGLRPENVHLVQPGPQSTRVSLPLAATVEIVEYFGPESNVTVQLGSDTVIMLAKGMAPRPGERIDVGVDLDHVHFFPLQENRGEP